MEKTPGTIKMIDKLYRMFPHMKYIHIIRDYRDVISSMKNVPWNKRRPFEDLIKQYVDTLEAGHFYYQKIPKEICMVISFERFVKEYETHLIKILDFLKVEEDKEFFNKVKDDIKIRKSNVSRYKTDLSDEEMSIVNNECKEIYEKWLSYAI